MRLSTILGTALFSLAAMSLSGCLAASAAGAVTGAAVGVTSAAVKTTVHVGHVAVDAAIPDGDKAKDDKARAEK
jgi:hypothetical protein